MASDAVRQADFAPAVSGGVALHEVWTAFLGFFIDIYDIYLPIIILAPAYAYFKPSALHAPILDSFIFASALLGRPAGALFFGYFADRLGRKRTAKLTMAGAGCCVFVTGLLPGFDSIGAASIVALIALRFATGFFAGGQYTGAVTLAMESCPPRRRGFYGALIGASSNLSFIVMAVFGMVLLRLLPAGGVDSPYDQWGWRLPFFAGAVLTLCLHTYITRSVRESEQWLRAERVASPFRALFGTLEVGGKLLQGFLLMSGLWLAYLVPAAMMPGLLHGVVGLPPIEVTALMLIAAVVTFFGFLGGGLLGDRIGRRAAFIGLGLLSAIVGPVLLHVTLRLKPDDFPLICLLASVVFGVVGLVWGSGPHSYLNERFHTGNRSSGYGITFSFAIILPSFFGVYQRWLSAFMPSMDAPSVLLLIGALLVVLAATWGPETLHRGDLD